MTVETTWLYVIEPTAEVRQLLVDLDSARARAVKADAANREDVVRFESLSARLERLAFQTSVERMPAGDDPEVLAEQVRARGLVPVLVVQPLTPGQVAVAAVTEMQLRPPNERWQSPGGERGRRAVELRFRSQIEQAIAGDGSVAIAPSGVQHSIVTETLREFVDGRKSAPLRVRVEYRDGSRSAHPFPLRALTLREDAPATDVELRLALLSIRHMDMDPTVDGAWLRNAEVSRPRPAAQTDDLVYRISRAQLDELTAGGRRVRIVLYQTGLETAVVGFYRALVDHLLERPGSVAVQPMYHAGGRPAKRKPDQPLTSLHAPYRTGAVWADAGSGA